jgi:GT2 family glycosyltransferase
VKVSFVIVNHNTTEILKDSVDSIYRFEKIPFEVIILNNTDEEYNVDLDALGGSFSNIKIIYLRKNLSYSAANNLGIKESSGEYVIIMNPDVIFTSPVTEKLISVMQSDSSIGAICPALISSNGNFQRNYFQRFPTIRQFIFYYSFLAGLFNKSAVRMNRYLENQEIDISSGRMFEVEQIPCAFFMTRKKILEEVNYMDEKFRLFFEDVDLSYRIGREYKLVIDTSVKVTHLGGESFKFADNWILHGLFISSMLYFFQKHYGKIRTFLLKSLVTLNSYITLFAEYILTGDTDSYRFKKHRQLLKLMREI